MSSKKYHSDIKNLASRLSVGESGYFICPKCARNNKLGITNTIDGLVFHCFSASCQLKGILNIPIGRDHIASILNKSSYSTVSNFTVPDHWITGFASENSVSMALKYDLLEGYRDKAFDTVYDPRLNRQVFYYKDTEDKIVGAVGRALSNQSPKAYIYPGSIKTPWIVGTSEVAVIVEDILSAVKIYNIGLTGIALSGTVLQLEYLNIFKHYTAIYVCLDKDATIKSLEMKKLLDMICPNVVIKFLEKDFKDLSRNEAKKVLS